MIYLKGDQVVIVGQHDVTMTVTCDYDELYDRIKANPNGLPAPDDVIFNKGRIKTLWFTTTKELQTGIFSKDIIRTL